MKRVWQMVLVFCMVLGLAVGCAPKMVIVEGTSNLVPGLAYVGAYTKHPTGMNVNRTDAFQNGKLISAGNTVHDTGIVNNMTKGMGAAALQAGGFVGGMAVLRPDNTTNTNTSNTNTAGTVAAGAVNASAKNFTDNKLSATSSSAVKNTSTNVNTNANFNANLNANKNTAKVYSIKPGGGNGGPGENGGNSGTDKPGHGYGDPNHDHTGPPGQQ